MAGSQKERTTVPTPTDPILAARPEAIKQLASRVSERVAVMDRDFNVIYANESAWSEGTSRWYIKPETQEGVRFFRSHASREQFNQGLIGMLVVEPRGSCYLSPFDGKPMASGWEAMIEDPKGADFREFAIFYHETGDEAFRLLNKKGEMLPQPVTGGR